MSQKLTIMLLCLIEPKIHWNRLFPKIESKNMVAIMMVSNSAYIRGPFNFYAGCTCSPFSLLTHLKFPGALDLLRDGGGPLEEPRERLAEVERGLELVVGQHPQQVVQDEDEAAPQHRAVAHLLLDGQPGGGIH